MYIVFVNLFSLDLCSLILVHAIIQPLNYSVLPTQEVISDNGTKKVIDVFESLQSWCTKGDHSIKDVRPLLINLNILL